MQYACRPLSQHTRSYTYIHRCNNQSKGYWIHTHQKYIYMQTHTCTHTCTHEHIGSSVCHENDYFQKALVKNNT